MNSEIACGSGGAYESREGEGVAKQFPGGKPGVAGADGHRESGLNANVSPSYVHLTVDSIQLTERSPDVDLRIRVIPFAVEVGLLLSFFSCNESENFVKGTKMDS